jgi:DNA (cytosine-5)-methyltransferase 1
MALPMKFVDICCGMGSFHRALAEHGMECVLACDIDPVVRDTYVQNYGIKPLGDLYSINPDDVPPFDILCAGFPCQPFSNAGHHRGFDDTRGNVFFEIMKWVERHHPRYVLFENVPALVSHDNGNTFRVICETLQAQGYRIAHKIVKCSDYGIPQMRKRVLLVGVRDGDPNTLLDFERFKTTSSLSAYLGKSFEKDTAYTIRCGGRGSAIGNKHNWDGYIVNGSEYRLTIEDGLRLQGFPASFKLAGSVQKKWHQLGNTIPTIFTQMLAENLRRTITSESPQQDRQTPV